MWHTASVSSYARVARNAGKEVGGCRQPSGTGSTCVATSWASRSGQARSSRSAGRAGNRPTWCVSTTVTPAWCSPARTRSLSIRAGRVRRGRRKLTSFFGVPRPTYSEQCALLLQMGRWRAKFFCGLLVLGGAAGAGSVDVQHGFAADAAAEQGVDRLGGLAPGAFQLDLGVEAAVCGQGAQARQVAGPAG